MRTLFNFIFCLLVIVSSVFLTKEFETYKPKSLPFIGSILEPFSEEGIHIRAKAYSQKDSIVYLNRDLLYRGLQPLQVTIQNNTPRSFYLSDEGLDLPNLNSRQVAGKLTRSAIPRSIAFRIAGFFFWPILIPGTIDTILTAKSYFQIKRDYYAKSIKDHPELIVPYSTVNRVIFVPLDQVSNDFTLHLQDCKNGNYYPFEIQLQG
ncbi:MAG: hypothetical protein JSS30_02590 [Verrucomicrobia bacterium]|nr:hypothetical protein [Verrucomicrobiota bacterium]